MTVRIAPADAPAAVAEVGPLGFLLTVGEAGGGQAVHATHVAVEVAGELLRVPAGRRSCRNALAAGTVTLLFPSVESDRMSLLVDGTATVEGEPGDGAVVVVRPTSGMWHRRPDSDARC